MVGAGIFALLGMRAPSPARRCGSRLLAGIVAGLLGYTAVTLGSARPSPLPADPRHAETEPPPDAREPRPPSLLDAILPVVVLILLIALTIVLFGVSATDGPLQVALLLSAAFASLIAFKNGYTAAAVADAAVGGVSTALGAIFILLAVGALIGTWNMAGTIPTVVDYGVRLLNPSDLLPRHRGDLRDRRDGHRQLVDDRRHARRRVRRDGEGDGPLRGHGRRRRHLRRLLRRQDDAPVGDDDPRPEARRRRPDGLPPRPQHVLDRRPGARAEPGHLPDPRPGREAERRRQHGRGAPRRSATRSTSRRSTCCRSRCWSCSP